MAAVYNLPNESAQRAAKYIEKKGMSIEEFSKEIGFSRSAVSQYLAGKYKSSTDKIDEAVEEFLSRAKTEVNKQKLINFFVSEDARNMMAVCQACQENAGLGVIVGRTGYGKSHTLREYSKLDRVCYIEADEVMTNRDLITAIELSIGLPKGYGSGWDRSNVIKEFFNVNKGYLLIIDEADKLLTKYTQKKMETLRNIFDQSNGGLIVAGEPQLESLIKQYIPRFANRVDFYVSLNGLSRKEVNEYLEGLEFTKEALEELVVRATNYQTGCFRLLDRTLRNILRILSDGPEKEKITLGIIEKASSMMML